MFEDFMEKLHNRTNQIITLYSPFKINLFEHEGMYANCGRYFKIC